MNEAKRTTVAVCHSSSWETRDSNSRRTEGATHHTGVCVYWLIRYGIPLAPFLANVANWWCVCVIRQITVAAFWFEP